MTTLQAFAANAAALCAVFAVIALAAVLAIGFEKLLKAKAWRRTNKQRALIDYESRWESTK